jgi:signal transduction histidine kinase
VVQRLLGSVRVRVTATALLAVTCALGVSALVLDASLHHDRQRVLMETAQEQAREVVAFNPDLKPPFALPVDVSIQSGLVQVLHNGVIVGFSRPLRYAPPLWLPGDPQVRSAPDVIADLATTVQVVAVPVTSEGTTDTVVVVMSLDQYDHTVAVVQSLLEVGTPVLLAVVGLICWLIVGRALRPIEMMRREVAEVVTVQASHRVAEPALDDEVGRLARTLNSMLDRIQASSERERRFVADASHELRSPIANIRTEIEVAMHRPAEADWIQVAGDVLAQNKRMEELVSGLLLLARSDEGSLLETAEPTNLAEVAGVAVASVGGGDPQVELIARPALVRVPPVYLERMVTNLLDNACRFANQLVTVSVGTEGDRAVLRVRDDGPGVAEEDRTRIFERFVRLDEARDRGEGGFGLGLAIVADLSRFYQGGIEVIPAFPGAEFVLWLPSSRGVAVAPWNASFAAAGTDAVDQVPSAVTPVVVGTNTVPPTTDGDAKVGTRRPTSAERSTRPVAGSSS